MDAFFAAIEERNRPRLRGKPIVVGSDPKGGIGRGVVSTANYGAREYGIHSAMPISKAWELSQKAKQEGKSDVVFLSTDGRRYAETSSRIMALIAKHFDCIEQASIDEFFIDLSFLSSFEEARKNCLKLKGEIKSKEKLNCSIGIGPNKLIAKIASDFQKPNGLTLIEPDEVERFLEPLAIRKIPGIGPKTELQLCKLNIQNIKDLKKLSINDLKQLLGKWGLSLYKKARGEDDSLVGEWNEIKSIGEQETFEKDTLDSNYIYERLRILSRDVFKRFTHSEFKNFRTITIAVRMNDFETKNRSRTLDEPQNNLAALEFEAIKLLYPFFDARENPNRKPIRLIGIRIEKLSKK